METLAQAFNRTNGKPIEHEGRVLQLSYWLPVEDGDRLRFHFVRFVERPVQGIGLTAERCSLQVANTSSKKIALWTDTAPRTVEVIVTAAKRGAKVGIMNQWKDEKYGTTLMGLNNAAIEVIEQADGSVLLRCSDGWGEVDSNDLVVTLKREPKNSQK